MSFKPHPALACPLDGLPVALRGNSLCCARGHSFDIARQGYVNLLGVQDKRSADPGDSKAMITARRDFLAAGHYLPIARQLGELLQPLLSGESLVADAGCGEGYYLWELADMLRVNGLEEPSFLGFDISKWAMQVAARRMAATWMVASNRHIPIQGLSVDVLISAFGFPDYIEFRRVLKKRGYLLLINTAPKHLLQLREIIYPQVKQTTPRHLSEAERAGFVLKSRVGLCYDMPALNRAAIQQLLAMTPHFFRTTAEGKRKAAALAQLQLSVDVVFELLQSQDQPV